VYLRYLHFEEYSIQSVKVLDLLKNLINSKMKLNLLDLLRISQYLGLQPFLIIVPFKEFLKEGQSLSKHALIKTLIMNQRLRFVQIKRLDA